MTAGGIRLTLEQKRAIERVVRRHPELLTMELSAPAAVERLIEHGVAFSDAQLALVADEGTVSGLKRVSSTFEAVKPRQHTATSSTQAFASPAGLLSRLRDLFGAAKKS